MPTNKPTLLNKLEVILLNVLSSLKVSVTDYCDIETTDGNYNIVLNNGALMTIIAYDGTRSIISPETFDDFIVRLTKTLSVYLAKSGYQFGMVFRRDLTPCSDLFKIAEIQKNTAATLKLDMDSLIDEAVDVYSNFVYDETNYIVLISHPSLLDESEVALEAKRKGILYKQYPIPSFADGQNILLANSFLKSRHETYVEAVMTALGDDRFSAQAFKLELDEALRSIKKAVDSQNTSTEWVPQIPSKQNRRKILARWKQNKYLNDASHHLWLPLPEQIMRTTISGVDRASAGTYPLGSVLTQNRIYCPLLIASPPQSDVTFNDLFINLNNASTVLPNGVERSLPYCFSFMLSGDGFAGVAVKKTLASILAVFSAENANIKGALDALTQYRDDGGCLVGMSMSAMTWAENNAYGIDEIQIRRSKLWRTIEAWGGCQVSEKGGDPILGYTSNLHGLTHKHHAPKYIAPLYNALYLFPWGRQASPFTMGTIMHRSVDGKLMRQESFSPELNTWIKIYLGRPGTGKSVAMNNDVIEACLVAGLKRLPLIFMIDVGISSRGSIELLQDRLPPEERHQAVYKRLKNDARFAINPLDCAVGRMQPTPNETAQIVAFLSTLITPIESMGKPEKGLSNFLTQVVEFTFASKREGSEKGKPNMYERYVDLELDGLLDELGINAYNRSYYALEDQCHDLQAYRARDLCHRYAMPIISDMIAVVSSNHELKSRYDEARVEGGESIIQLFRRGVTEAIAMYPVFSTYTKFNIDTARVVSLDLQDVIGSNPKQSSLFFQIARIFAKKKLAFEEDDVALFPLRYQEYYRNYITEILEDKKIIAIDELHNAKKDLSLFAELERDCRESRKWNMELKFASQMMEDFGLVIPQLATQFVIADRGTDDSRAYLRNTISLRPIEEYYLSNFVSLNAGGLTYLSRTVSKKSAYVSLLTLTIGPQRLWSLTTDADDRLLRSTLYDMLGDRPAALKLLAIVYPFGARKVMNSRKEALRKSRNDAAIAPEDLDSMARIMAKELMDNKEAILASAKKAHR
ncbi:hypothetical protein [Pedobacter sp.]|uniref:hypothetical protein n=1 Tax=Pedobacter sp. TaxID=1411316 RepID=UPI003D7FC7EA